jgi:hypothetical protein
MRLEYVPAGDYQIPALTVGDEDERILLKYGLMRKTFLRKHQKGIYTEMLLQGTLQKHLLEIQDQAEDRMEALVKEMSRKENVDENLKEQDQMLWLRKMENIRQTAEEIVLQEIIYS